MKYIFLFHIMLLAISYCPAQSTGLKKISLENNWKMRQKGTVEWNNAKVPGNVHTDLLRNKKIPDPFWGENEKQLQWIERVDWEYEHYFTLTEQELLKDNATLVFEGLDTYAKVTLNGQPVITASNMFRQWKSEVKQHLKKGKNHLHIDFESPILKALPKYDSLDFKYPANNDQAEKKVSIFTRKAGYHYGWDWGPRFVTSGIWRPVYLLTWNKAKLDNVQLIQKKVDSAHALILSRITIQTSKAGAYDIHVSSPDASVHQQRKTIQVPEGLSIHDIPLQIDHPRLWWPNGSGDQHLYDIDFALKTRDQTLDSKNIEYGIRTIEVVHENDTSGKSFYLKINGVPLFMKGANYIPSDNFLDRVDGQKYEMLISSAVEGNMNMLRVWGGGIYENDQFYELCDRKGILVWQDFMFACSMYPGDQEFLNNVQMEASDNIRRLRNHPCLALWCGNNENETAWFHWGWASQFKWTKPQQEKIWYDYQKIFHEIIPSVVYKEDSGRFYHRSSPSANDDKIQPDSLGFGDKHYWGVWHAEEPYRNYSKNISRFMSEYGFQSFPELKTIRSYATPKDFDIESSVMLHHQRHPRGNQLIREYMSRDYHQPKDFASFLYTGQVLQAEIIKFAAEAHRRAMPYNMGSLYWQLNDCWPVASWSGMDYYGRWKAQHFFAKKFFQPLLVSFDEHKDSIHCYIISDLRNKISGKVNLKLMDFNGKIVWSIQKDIIISANTSHSYIKINKTDLLKYGSSNSIVLIAELKSNDTIQSVNHFYFAPPKDLSLPPVKFTTSLEKVGTLYHMTIRSSELAKNVYLEAAASELKFSDNYFDLLPGEHKVIKISSDKNITKEALKKQIRITSLIDSY